MVAHDNRASANQTLIVIGHLPHSEQLLSIGCGIVRQRAVCGGFVNEWLVGIPRVSQQLRNAHFDGIICIGGEDWWYHNRGHYDFQIMRRLAKYWPVLFVNSIGVRVPSTADKRVFLERIGRKIKSLSRGFVTVEPGFHVYSPLTVPGTAGQSLTRWALAPQIKIAARRAGIRQPLLWIHCPEGAGLDRLLDPVATVMQRTDRFESFPEADGAIIQCQIDYLKAHSDLVIYASQLLYDEERASVQGSMLAGHGVDIEYFISAGDCVDGVPVDIEGIHGPRVGFIGGIDRHTFDPELFCGVVERLPNVNFVMVGGSSMPEGWIKAQNVHFIGRKPYDQIASYMAAMDVLIMPWNRSPWIEACNPIKLKEYLAVGRPIVTRDFKALDSWRSFVRVAENPEAFAREINDALEQAHDPTEARLLLKSESWDMKAMEVAEAIATLPLKVRGTASTVMRAA